MTVTNEDQGRQNVFAKEPQMQVMEVTVTHNEKAEMLNGRFAILSFLSALSSSSLPFHLLPLYRKITLLNSIH